MSCDLVYSIGYAANGNEMVPYKQNANVITKIIAVNHKVSYLLFCMIIYMSLFLIEIVIMSSCIIDLANPKI